MRKKPNFIAMNNKYTLINCYSDSNKGDLGIILSTIDYIKNNDSEANIKCISTYNFSDPAFLKEHIILKKYSKVYPSIFGELNIITKKSTYIKIIRLLWDTLRLILIILFPISFGKKIFFSKQEKKTLKIIQDSDYIISKGGSFICNENNWRDKIALIRFLYIFLLCFKLNKKVIILFQSLGPVYGRLSIRYVNYVINKCYKVVLREKVCFQKYPYIKYPKDTIFSNDIAFYLPTLQSKIITGTEFKIGITTKYVGREEIEYKKMMVEGIENILSKYNNMKIYFFNHVPIDNDIESSWEIYKDISDSYKNRISFITDNYNPTEIKYLYGKMDAFIGTRLHSTIFAMGECVPSLCIAYHGTKAQGILKNMDSGNYVVRSYDTKEFINKFNELCNNLSSQKKTLKNRLDYWSIDMNQNFKKIFNDK